MCSLNINFCIFIWHWSKRFYKLDSEYTKVISLFSLINFPIMFEAFKKLKYWKISSLFSHSNNFKFVFITFYSFFFVFCFTLLLFFYFTSHLTKMILKIILIILSNSKNTISLFYNYCICYNLFLLYFLFFSYKFVYYKKY